jgi:hypothetical protein
MYAPRNTALKKENHADAQEHIQSKARESY